MEKKENKYTVKISVDTTELDLALEKTKQLVALMEKQQKLAASADEIASAVRRCLKNELQVAGSITDKKNQKSDLLRRFTVKGEAGREALKIVEKKKLSRQEVATLITGIEMFTQDKESRGGLFTTEDEKGV